MMVSVGVVGIESISAPYASSLRAGSVRNSVGFQIAHRAHSIPIAPARHRRPHSDSFRLLSVRFCRMKTGAITSRLSVYYIRKIRIQYNHALNMVECNFQLFESFVVKSPRTYTINFCMGALGIMNLSRHSLSLHSFVHAIRGRMRAYSYAMYMSTRVNLHTRTRHKYFPFDLNNQYCAASRQALVFDYCILTKRISVQMRCIDIIALSQTNVN